MVELKGWRQKISPEEMFFTTGENLLGGEREATKGSRRYKSIDRSELALAFKQSL